MKNKIKEASGTATALGGARQSGYVSATTKSAKKAYDTAQSDYVSKKSDYDTKATDYTNKKNVYDKVNLDKKYRKAQRGGGYLYTSNKATAKSGGYTENPEWTTAKSDAETALSTRSAAKTAATAAETKRDSNLTKYQSSQDVDTVAKKAPKAGTKRAKEVQPPAVASAGGYGTGKSAGKGKGGGKGKGKGKKEESYNLLNSVKKELNDSVNLINLIKDDNKKTIMKEWNQKPPTEKRWSGAYKRKDGLTEFEARGGKDKVNETVPYGKHDKVKFRKFMDMAFKHAGTDPHEIAKSLFRLGIPNKFIKKIGDVFAAQVKGMG
tara:strand:+ start:3193 stop:4158 length:966 start_codon:yes stop_codon:yes gene_type:complete